MKKKRKEAVVSAILFIVAAAILIAMSGRATEGPAYDLLSKFAFALLVAVVLRLTLVYLYGGDAEAFDKFQDLGMEELYYPLTQEDLKARLGESDHIQVLKTWFPETTAIEDGLKKAITKNKATVRLLLCDPRSDLLRKRSKSADSLPSEGSNKNYRAVYNIYNWWRQAPEADVRINFYDDWPGCPVIWYGTKYGIRHSRKIIMGFYFRKKSSPSWPWIRIKPGTELAQILDEQYDDLLKLSKTELTDLTGMEVWLEENKRFVDI
ncbi:MAG TPA: hypothetical protein VJM50_07970 [Pyrinomonadaceae bacterium]|nr:hypothetical protein [Pyrinomonadaceae bacterium]